MNGLIVLFICLVFTCKVYSSQYIYAFTSENSFLAIDIQNGVLMTNQTLPQNFDVDFIYDFDDASTFQLIAYSQESIFLVDYDFESNVYSNIGPNISSISQSGYSNVAQNIDSIGALNYIPITLSDNTKNVLNVLCLDFKYESDQLLNFQADGYNSKIPIVASFDDDSGLYYVLYFNNSNVPFIMTITTPLINNQVNGVVTYNFGGKGGIAFTPGFTGRLFSTQFTQSVYYIQVFPSNITVCELDFTNLQCKAVFFINVKGGYSKLFPPFFFSDGYFYLVILTGGQTADDQILYSFVDLSSFTIVSSFYSDNFYTTQTNSNDLNFYFNGDF